MQWSNLLLPQPPQPNLPAALTLWPKPSWSLIPSQPLWSPVLIVAITIFRITFHIDCRYYHVSAHLQRTARALQLPFPLTPCRGLPSCCILRRMRSRSVYIAKPCCCLRRVAVSTACLVVGIVRRDLPRLPLSIMITVDQHVPLLSPIYIKIDRSTGINISELQSSFCHPASDIRASRICHRSAPCR